MAIKVLNTTVVNDSRSLTNIQNATINGATSIIDNTALGTALSITQTDVGPCLVVETASGVGNEPFTIDSDGKVCIGKPSTMPENTSLLINDNTNILSIGLRNQNVAVNGVYGHSISVENGSLHFKSRTDTDFTTTLDNVSALTISSSNRVGVRTDDPGYNLDIRGEARIISTPSNNGIWIQPNTNPEVTPGRHTIAAANSSNSNLRELSFAGALTRFYTGNGTSANVRWGIDQFGNPTFNNPVSAAAIVGPGLDWTLVNSVTVNNTSTQVVVSFSSSYKHFCIVLDNITFPANGIVAMRYVNSGITAFQTGTHYSNALVNLGVDSNFSSVNFYNANTFWYLSQQNVRVSNSGSISAKIFFYDPRSNSRLKTFTAEGLQNWDSASTDYFYSFRSAGTVDISSVDKICGGVGFVSNQNFSSGTLHVFGLRG